MMKERAELMEAIRAFGVDCVVRLEALEELEALAERTARAAWVVNPGAAITKAAAIDRHARLIGAAVVFARTVRSIVLEELEDTAARARRGGGSSGSRL